MKYVLLITVLAFAPAISRWSAPRAATQAGGQAPADSAPKPVIDRGNDLENSRKARTLIGQAIQALGGQAYLNLRNVQEEGRTYTFYHGRPTSSGLVFWRFTEFPDKERIELTKQRDVAYLYLGDKGYELTFKGPHPVEKKDLEDYVRRHRFSLDAVLRTWVTDPSVAFFYEGSALAGNLPAERVTLINAKNEAVSLFFDIDSHLPLKKSYTWRDPVDKERNTEEEIYANYRSVQGVMTYWDFTRYYNGDMQTQRFDSAVRINQPLNEAMFDPNSGYDPNKSTKH